MPDYELGTAPWRYEKFEKVVIKDGVTSIGLGAFYKCSSLTSITIPNSVTSIGSVAFANCRALTSITIPNSVTSIGEKVFHYCSNLTAITVEKGNTKYDSRDNCNAIIETKSNTLIYGCENTVIPNSITSIGADAFAYCTALTSITIPNSVTNIGDCAFYDCKGLTSITFEGSTHPTFGYLVFDYVNKSIPVYVPANSIEEYKNVLGGLGFSNIQANPKQLFLTDNDSYTRDSETDGMDISYTRNFTNTKWQAIYLPFSLKYNDWKDDLDMAYINTVRQYDRDKDGVIDETAMEIVKMKSGSTAPNRPYLIRAKSKGEKTITVKDATVSASENKGIDCSTTIAKFTITGTYKPIPSETMIANNYYAMGGGKLIHSDGSNGLKPYRWYMKVEARDYSKYKVSNAAKAITIKVLDDEETTGIDELQIANSNSSVYDINGRMVNENSLKPGMYIKNGRKIIIK